MSNKNISFKSNTENKNENSKPPFIHSYLKNGFILDNKEFIGPIIVTNNKVVNWRLLSRNFSFSDFEFINKINYKPEFVLFGVGKTFDNPMCNLKSEFTEKNLSLELMTTHSACRVWNLNINDNRKIIGFFIPLNYA